MHVTLYEKEAVCGGHTLTDGSGPVPVDLGFQVWKQWYAIQASLNS